MTHNSTYLFVVLFWLVVLIIFLWTAGPHRKISVIAGLCYVCALPLYIPFEKEYWSPYRLGGWVLGIEDALLLFVLGSLPWAVIGSILRTRLTTKLHWPTFIPRYGWLFIIGTGTFLSLWALGMLAISASIVAQIIVSILAIGLRRDLWPLALTGFVTFVPIYFVCLNVSYWLWPDFVFIWNSESFWGSKIMGLPIGEIMWASSGAWGCPVALGYIVNAQLDSNSNRSSCDLPVIIESKSMSLT